MNKESLKELIKDALTQNVNEKALVGDQHELPDFIKDKIKSATEAALSKKPQVEELVNEDLDIGHQDDEPRMIKSDLYLIAKSAVSLYKMVDGYDDVGGEVDFPAWWQAKITAAKNTITSAQEYLDNAEKIDQIDAMMAGDEYQLDNIDDIEIDTEVDVDSTEDKIKDMVDEVLKKGLK